MPRKRKISAEDVIDFLQADDDLATVFYEMVDDIKLDRAEGNVVVTMGAVGFKVSSLEEVRTKLIDCLNCNIELFSSRLNNITPANSSLAEDKNRMKE